MTPNLFVIFMGFFNVESIERNDYVVRVSNLFTCDEQKDMNLTYILYQNRVSSVLMNLPWDFYLNSASSIEEKPKQHSNSILKISAPKKSKSRKISLDMKIPDYLFKGTNMNVFNFVPYKSIRQANWFCKKWLWINDNKKITIDFIHILSRYRLWEGFELVHTCNNDLMFVKVFCIEKHNVDEEKREYECTAQYFIKQDRKNPTCIKTELYLEKESGFYSIKQK